MQRRTPVLLVFLALLATGMSCRKKAQTEPPAPPVQEVKRAPAETAQPPKRIVLFIGDGMGVGQITAASYMRGEPLRFLELPHVGFMTTHGYEFLTTDSAASATAMSTGHKTHYEGVAVVPGTTEAGEEDPQNHLQTLMELASERGLRTGMVATSRITHATPAAFAAHRYDRHQYEGIAADYASSDLDVLIGSGWRHFDQRADGRDLVSEMREKGWAVAKSAEELDAISDEALRVAALMGPKDMPFLIDEEERPMQLPEMVKRAIGILDRGDPDGWVLMVEGSFIDWCGHQLDAACAAVETIDLDEAVSVARDYADERDDTLIVVTGDHETAGLSVIDPYYAARFTGILGGEEKATALAAQPSPTGEPIESPPPVQHIAIGAGSAQFAPEALPAPDSWELSNLVDGRASLVVGHFSMESRTFWRKPGRFYGVHTPVIVSIHAEGPGAEHVVASGDNADLGRALRELVAGNAAKTRPVPSEAPPKNVILMIGDGMGLPSITGAHYYTRGLHMLTLPHEGLVSTHGLDYLVNDSAASATAMGTGVRTRKKSVGMRPDGERLVPADSIVERAERRGLATGIVTTTPITHATPAAFYAHREDRYDLAGVLDDLATLHERTESDGIDLLVGGGASRVDRKAREQLAAAGYSVATTWPPSGSQIVAVLADDGLPHAATRRDDGDASTPTLAEMTTFALEHLSPDEDGFLLIVEGGQIDWRLHRGVRDATIFDEVSDFDGAVRVASTFAAERRDTLVVVTADHDHTMGLFDNHYVFESGRCGVAASCGGPLELVPISIDAATVPHTEGFSATELQAEYAPPRFFVQYAWPVQEALDREDTRASHSANFVPIFATGPWGHHLRGFHDQPEIGRLLVRWVESRPPR